MIKKFKTYEAIEWYSKGEFTEEPYEEPEKKYLLIKTRYIYLITNIRKIESKHDYYVYELYKDYTYHGRKDVFRELRNHEIDDLLNDKGMIRVLNGIDVTWSKLPDFMKDCITFNKDEMPISIV